MKYATRMLLIPEDVYLALMGTNATASSSSTAAAAATPLAHAAQRLARVEGDQVMAPDERAIHHQQEFKRYAKLRQEAEERPVNVNVQNLSKVLQQQGNATAVGQSSISSSALQQHPPKSSATKTKSSPLKRRKMHAANRTIGTENGDSGSGDTTAATDEAESEYNTPPASTKVKKSRHELVSSEKGTAAAANLDDEAASNGALASQQASTTTPLSNSAEAKRQAIEYVRKHPARLGLGENLEVFRLMRGTYRPVKRSNALELLEYHFGDTTAAPATTTTTPTTSRRRRSDRKPPGYQTFINACAQDPYMSTRIFHLQQRRKGHPSQKSSETLQSGEGVDLLLTAFKKRQRKCINTRRSVASRIHFKPRLWS